MLQRFLVGAAPSDDGVNPGTGFGYTLTRRAAESIRTTRTDPTNP